VATKRRYEYAVEAWSAVDYISVRDGVSRGPQPAVEEESPVVKKEDTVVKKKKKPSQPAKNVSCQPVLCEVYVCEVCVCEVNDKQVIDVDSVVHTKPHVKLGN